MTAQTMKPLPSLPARYTAGVALVFLASLLAFWLVMQPSRSDLGLMAVFLSVTALVSIFFGYLAYRTGWLSLAPSLRLSLLGGYILSSGLTFLNVWVTARLMFASPHDLVLATILLAFASGIAVVLGLFLSSALADRIRIIELAARSIARGELDVHVDLHGRDEMAELAGTFNEMAAQLDRARKAQVDAERLRADLIAWISHDLQTPMASMRAMIEALADGVVSDPETVARYLGAAQQDIHQLSALIDDLFQMAQLDAGGFRLELEQASLVDLLSDTLESFSALAGQKGVQLHVATAQDAGMVRMDTRAIGRVLNNLVSNAIRHTPGGGTVAVQATRRGKDVVVTVADSGGGIATEDLPHVFERFYKGEKSRSRLTGGAGLGLAIARGIVQAHGGEIGVESASGSGTIFTFTIPG